MSALGKSAPIVVLHMDGVSKQYDNPYLRAYLEKAVAAGGVLRIYTQDPTRTIVQGGDSGDSPTPWVYGHHVDTYTTAAPDGVIHIPPSGVWIKYFSAGDSLDPDYWRYGSYAEFPGGQFTFVRIDGNGDSYGYGGNAESNSAFFGAFVRGAVVWAVVVGTIVYTAGAVSDYGLTGAVATETAALPIAPATAVTVETVATVAPAVAPGWTLSGALAAAKTATGAIVAVKSAVASVQNAVSGSGSNPPPPDPAPQSGENNTLMYAAIAGALILIL